jgi:CTP:molybdopterin cytidylyltransferase MocA
MPFNEIAAIIPASGKGGRFGTPKANAGLNGKTFAQMVHATLKEAGITKIILAEAYDTPDQLSTIRQAVREKLPPQATGIVVFPVDHPFVLAATVRALCNAWLSNRDAAIRPIYEGKPGHPVIIPAWLDLDQDDGGQGLAGLIRSQACTVIDLPVDDRGVVRNINAREDLNN